MLQLNHSQAKPTAPPTCGATANRTRGRRLVSAFALLTVCFIAGHSLPSMASENFREPAKSTTKTTLSASTTTIKEHAEITLKATVSPSKAKGTVVLYGRVSPTSAFKPLDSVVSAGGVAKFHGRISVTGKVGFKAVYEGFGNYKKSTSNIVNVEVTK